MTDASHLEHKRRLTARTRRLVVKIGSGVLAGASGGIDQARIDALADEIAAIRAGGRTVIVVTSGAVAAGAARLGMSGRPRTIPLKQAAAAVGQIGIMAAYEAACAARGLRVAQVLLTRDDLSNRRRYLNAKHAMMALLELDVVPIVNENDTVVVEEIKLGDNDNLSALTATLVDADLLVILSDVAGLHTCDPRQDPTATLVPVVPVVTPAIEAMAGGHGHLGTGGMATKLAAAKQASASGIATVIADGRTPGVLAAVLDPERALGTLVLPVADRLARRKHWIAYTLKPSGSLVVDDGARRALAAEGRSLLPSGLRAVEGHFGVGACVRCVGLDGTEFARGLVSYSAAELDRIKGRHSRDIESILGYKVSDEVVHRDDLVLDAQHVPAGAAPVTASTDEPTPNGEHV
jgi:glutamate 5-kinase